MTAEDLQLERLDLAGLGFEPITAAVLALVANTAPVAFGSFGIPALALGALAGGRLSSRLDPRVFRTIVYVLLLVLGARFLMRAF